MKKNILPHTDCLDFAAQLKEAFSQAGIHDLARIGSIVANAEESPERDIPYHPAVVDAWLKGTYLPSETTFAAIQDVLADKILPSFEYAYEAAMLHTYNFNEIGITLQARYKEHGFILKSLCAALTDKGVRTRCGTAYTPSALVNIFTGSNQISTQMIPALDELLPPKEGEASLAQLHAMIHPTPEQLLEKAAATDDIHRALRYMRRALGLNLRGMAKNMAEHLPENSTVSHVAVSKWELLDNKAQSSLPVANTLPGTDLITVYGNVLTDHGFGPWVEQHDTHLRQILESAIRQRHNLSKYDMPYAFNAARPSASSLDR